MTIFPYDDRVEHPEGVTAAVTDAAHPALGGVPTDWPQMLGYNQLVARSDAAVLAQVGVDPLVVVGEYGNGRSVAFASDLAPHWRRRNFSSGPTTGSCGVHCWFGLPDLPPRRQTGQHRQMEGLTRLHKGDEMKQPTGQRRTIR